MAGVVVSILIVLLIVVIVVGIFIIRRKKAKRSNPADVALTEANYREFSGPNVVTTENNTAYTSNKEIELKYREDNTCNQAVDGAVLTEANVAYGQFTGNSIVTSENVAYGRYSTKNDSRVVSNDMDRVYELEGNYEYI